MNTNAQELFSTILALLPSPYQKETFNALMATLLGSDGHARAEHTEAKDPAAVSRFLNHYAWNTRSLIRTVRQAFGTHLSQYYARRRGRRPILYALIDLTTLEKTGKFPHLPIYFLNGKRGLHLVVLYLVINEVRIPYAFKVWRGRGTTTPGVLALKLLRSLPIDLKRQFKIRVLADAGFGHNYFLRGVQRLGMQALVGMRWDRKLDDERYLYDCYNGQKVQFKNLKLPLWVARYVLKKPDGTKELRFAVATFQATGAYLVKLGRKRWLIEQLFKLAKHRFSLHQFGQRSAKGVYRFLILSLLAYLLARWHAVATQRTVLPDWGELAFELACLLVPEVLLLTLLKRLLRIRDFLFASSYRPELRCKL